jgi:inosine-uridine nucleoside N-ribohydrolase
VIHDALTIATAIDKSFVTIKPYHVHVVTMVPDDDPTRGMTMADTRAQTILRRKEDPTYNIPNVDVAVEVDGERWINFFIDRVKK